MMSQMGPSPGNFTGGAPSAQQEERKVLNRHAKPSISSGTSYDCITMSAP